MLSSLKNDEDHTFQTKESFNIENENEKSDENKKDEKDEMDE